MELSINEQLVQDATKLIKNSKHIFVITGAGISADSGLPTYRGIGGIYENQMTEEGLEIEEILSIDMFYKKPELSWKYIKQLVNSSEDKKYNLAHKILAILEKEKDDFCILTQNVDGFHLDAGSNNVIEIHGNLRRLICLNCGFSKEVQTYKNISIPPRCNKCNHILKPDVVLFGEYLPLHKVAKLERELSKDYDLFIIIGTTGIFPYIYEPVFNAIQRRIPTIEINPSKTIFSNKVSIHFSSGASHILSKIYEYYKQS